MHLHLRSGPRSAPPTRSALIRFLVDVVGFEETVVYADGDVVHHAQLSWPLGGGIMLGSIRDDGDDRWPIQPGTFGAYVVVDDPDALFDRVKAGGAEITDELHETDYGSRDFAIRDPEGNRWSFGTYRGEPRNRLIGFDRRVVGYATPAPVQVAPRRESGEGVENELKPVLVQREESTVARTRGMRWIALASSIVTAAGLAVTATSGTAGAAPRATAPPTAHQRAVARVPGERLRRRTGVSILPPGENGLVNATDAAQFEANGTRPPNSQDQLGKYANLLYGYPKLTDATLGKYYDDESFGVKPADITRTETPKRA